MKTSTSTLSFTSRFHKALVEELLKNGRRLKDILFVIAKICLDHYNTKGFWETTTRSFAPLMRSYNPNERKRAKCKALYDAMENLYRNPVTVDEVGIEVRLVNCGNVSDPGSRKRSGTHVFILGKKKRKKMISTRRSSR
ncbi:uncharacterized [Tachysurus ichikawai]